MQPKWLEWAQKIQAIAQKGLLYNKNPYQIEDYKLLRNIASEIISTHTQIDQSEILDLLVKEIGYPTPKVAVSSAVFQENKILLVKQRSDGFWSLPGGFTEVGESPGEVAVRETFEESGYQTKPIKLLSVYDNNNNKHGHTPFPYGLYKLCFQCEIIGGKATTSIETEEVGFFAEDNIPPLSINRVTTSQITRLFEHYRNPDLPTDFD
ncbi:ADP-ribose pyrophosphatase [Rivularia sp. PCC 7116]|uniref:NUDIX hydrolase n=1 Tax=Rivularia sp. PCC 7116 TaxID=373994 RepID=UPI00029F0604|nr:NUDIX hydrolase [Rivularia sp. PCC 7116]AFY55775.1 ADP-ribose pyrophosphatase [Rivularia sp. PCC 7116]